jgi:methylmalonyl-CoA/ethylmalonyl-CoA epimerase
MRFEHIGIAVENIENYFETVLASGFDCKLISPVYMDVLQDSKVAFAKTCDGTKIELIEPLSSESPVSTILRNRRGGLHHLCFRADHFEQDLEKLRKNKFILVSPPKQAIAFNNRRVAFFLSPANELIELLEEEMQIIPHPEFFQSNFRTAGR